VLGLRATNPFDDDESGKGRYIAHSQIGCYLSHLAVLRTALANNDDSFFVFEDDVKFVPNFKSRWEEAVDEIPPDAEVVQLQWHYPEDPISRKYVEIHNDHFAKCVTYPFCTAAIYWTRSAAKKAIRLLNPVDNPFDVALLHRVYPFVNHYIAYPKLADQSSLDGDVSSDVNSAPKAETEQENDK
jgi:GR25 family glycosyltransferase involved in LPS biosynthesis